MLGRCCCWQYAMTWLDIDIQFVDLATNTVVKPYFHQMVLKMHCVPLMVLLGMMNGAGVRSLG
jgi:hypothetical protein